MISGDDWVPVDYKDPDTWPPDAWVSVWVREVFEDRVLETLRMGMESHGEIERGRAGILEWKLFV